MRQSAVPWSDAPPGAEEERRGMLPSCHARPRARRLARVLPLAVLLGAVGAAHAAEWRVETARSVLAVNVFRAGALSSQLHDHRFAPTRWNASLKFDPQRPSAAALQVSVDAASLRDVETSLKEKDREGAEHEMLGPKVLDVQRFPLVRFELQHLQVDQQSPDGQLLGTLTGWLELHGQRRPLTVPVHVRWDANQLDASGAVTFKQSDFGIKPYKKLLGSIAVHDEVRLEARLTATAVPGS
jgi:polyisoprenoid-binding protein YceI